MERDFIEHRHAGSFAYGRRDHRFSKTTNGIGIYYSAGTPRSASGYMKLCEEEQPGPSDQQCLLRKKEISYE